MSRPSTPPWRPWGPERPKPTPRTLRRSKLRSAFAAFVRFSVLEALAGQAGPIHYHELRCLPDLRPIDWRAVREAVDALVLEGAVARTEDGDRIAESFRSSFRLSRYALADRDGKGAKR